MKSVKRIAALIGSIVIAASGLVGIPIRASAMEAAVFYETLSYDIASGEETTQRYSFEEYIGETSQSNVQPIDQLSKHAFSKEVLAPASVIGEDSRILVTNSTLSPYRMVVLFYVHFTCSAGETHSFTATGFMIGPNTVATAGHAIYIHQQKMEKHGGCSYHGWGSVTTVAPGANDGNVSVSRRPYGETGAYSLTVGGNWANNADETDDWGLIRINENIGYETGIVNLSQISDDAYNITAYNAGYPIMVNGQIIINEKMYYSQGQVKSCDDRILYCAIDATAGHSGGPITDSRFNVIGIVSMSVYVDNEYEGLSYPLSQTRGIRLFDWLYNKFTQFQDLEVGENP